jgi:membrane protease YdiL (CAAX protease family)
VSSFERVLEHDGPDGQHLPSPAAAAGIDAVGPNLGHALLLLVLAAALLTASQFGVILLAQQLHIYGRHSTRAYAELMSGDARWLVPSQAFSYLLVLVAIVPIFRGMWQRGFAAGLHWNVAQAQRYFLRLLVLGLGCGFGIAALGSVLPMPKDPPIMADLLHSPLGAWLMLLFGVTGAPLFEEMCFRGFLLPGFLNTFRWLSVKGDISPQTARWVGIPFSVIFTSLPFALMHAPQVSHAWAPVLLIGLVSVVLCVVRLRLNSVACSAVVHAAYNFTLFAGLLVETGGFRHLERLAH